MMNFRIYPQVTKISIPNNLILSSTNFSGAFYNMKNLKTIELPDTITNIVQICYNCNSLTTAFCGNNVVGNVRSAYFNCRNLTEAVCGDNVTEMVLTYSNCTNLTTAVCGNNVYKMEDTYVNCSNLRTAVCGENVKYMSYTYQYCTNLTTAVCGDNVISMTATYANCPNLTTAVCGDNVVGMSNTYRNCKNLKVAACGNAMTNIANFYNNVYYNCFNLTTAACGENVTDMSNAYSSCARLTTAVCGNNVTDMDNAYCNCINLRVAACGENVTYMESTYQNCPNIQGNAYFYSNNVTNLRNCFGGRNTSNRLNIYAHNGSTTRSKLTYTNSLSLIGTTITWTNDTANNRLYNTTYNIYIYPVANVRETYLANEYDENTTFVNNTTSDYIKYTDNIASVISKQEFNSTGVVIDSGSCFAMPINFSKLNGFTIESAEVR